MKQIGQQSADWLRAFRVYLSVIMIGNLTWETIQLPLYTIWSTGTWREQTFAVVHCTLGDLLIALSVLVLALLLIGRASWPNERFWAVALLATILGVAYTGFSEWLNVVVRASWSYSEYMPVVWLFGFDVGLSPLLQWVVVPAAAFKITRAVTIQNVSGGVP